VALLVTWGAFLCLFAYLLRQYMRLAALRREVVHLQRLRGRVLNPRIPAIDNRQSTIVHGTSQGHSMVNVYLVLAYGFVWGIFMLYAWMIHGRQKRLEREVEELKGSWGRRVVRISNPKFEISDASAGPFYTLDQVMVCWRC